MKNKTPNWPLVRTMMAKATRLPEDEVEILVRQFKESGLAAEVSSYEWIGSQLTSPDLAYHAGRTRQGLQIAKNVIKWPFEKMKRMGFNTGEELNLSMLPYRSRPLLR